MDNKVFYIVLAVLVAAFVTFAVVTKEPTEEKERLGYAHEDEGRKHVDDKEYDDSAEPLTSGAHASPIPWGSYESDLKEVNTIHNLEHGGIYVSYQPNLPDEQVQAMKELLFEPYGDSEFKPKKVILAPRAANSSPIVVSSWLRSMKLEKFDAQKILDYYETNAGKSPEPLAQ